MVFEKKYGLWSRCKLASLFPDVNKNIGLIGALIFLFSVIPGFAEQASQARIGSADLFAQAEFHFHSEDLFSAKQFYQKFLDLHGEDVRVEKTLYRLGQIEQKKNSAAAAISFYEMLLRRFPDTFLAPDITFNMAECYFGTEKLEESERLFRKISETDPDKNRRLLALFYLGRIDEKRFDYENAISKIKKTYVQSESKEVREQSIRLIEKIIYEKLSKAHLITLTAKFRSGFPVDHLLLKLISIYRAERDVVAYQSALEEFLRLFPEHPRHSLVEKELSHVREHGTALTRLGVVLPLTGKNALIGQKVLQGIQLAMNQSAFELKGKLELVVKNSDSAKGLLEVAEDLATDPNVVGIIGPVLSEEVTKIASIAETYQVPFFTPSASHSGLVDLNPYIFRNALTREMQGRFVAEHAIKNLGLRRYAVFYPLEPYGMDMKDSFVEEVESLGGEVVATVSYERTQTDFRKQIADIGGMDDDELKKLVNDQLLKNIHPPDLGEVGVLSKPGIEMGHLTEDKVENLKVSLDLSYDAIFLPGFYDKVGLILPQLAFYNIANVILLGGNGWNSPELAKIEDKYLKNGYFVDGFFADSKNPQVRQFVKKYESTFGEKPTSLSAQSYDAARIFIEMVLGGVHNRINVRERLNSVRDFPGVSGKTTILPSGESEKELFTLWIKRKKIAQVN